MEEVGLASRFNRFRLFNVIVSHNNQMLGFFFLFKLGVRDAFILIITLKVVWFSLFKLVFFFFISNYSKSLDLKTL
jgi:hypothetical protein